MEQKKKYSCHLTTKNDVRRLLSQTINQLRRDEIERETARALGFLCNCILAVLESMQEDDLEQRLEKLEAQVNEMTR